MPRTGPRRVMACIGPPIDVREQLGKKSREAIATLTGEMQRLVQYGIHTLNTANDAPGGRLVDSPHPANT